MKIRVSKELLLNLGNFSNIKIIAEVTGEDFKKSWAELNAEIKEQEILEKSTRLAPKPTKELVTGADLPF